MVENKIDALYEMLEKNIKADNKTAIVDCCTLLLGYSIYLDEKTQVSLFLTKGITLLKLQHYTLALLNVKRAIAIKNDTNCQQALECIKLRLME